MVKGEGRDEAKLLYIVSRLKFFAQSPRSPVLTKVKLITKNRAWANVSHVDFGHRSPPDQRKADLGRGILSVYH